ncbi:unnamed protein product [Leuciscus chuanchicus]
MERASRSKNGIEASATAKTPPKVRVPESHTCSVGICAALSIDVPFKVPSDNSDTQTEEELQNGGMEIISEREERTTAEKTKRRRNNTEKPGRRRDGEN